MQDVSEPAIATSVVGQVATVRINRPRKKNAVTFAMWTELAQLFRNFDDDAEVRAIILTGNGDCFSAGADISEFAELRGTAEQAARYEKAVDGALATIAGSRKPTIAAVSGICFGGAVALAASADFRIADATAQFSVSAVRMGLVYNVSKCEQLFRVVGLRAAKRILLTGGRFSATEALAMGLADRIVDVDAIGAAYELADALAAGAPQAVDGIKSILDAIAAGTLDSRRRDLEHLVAAADASEDHREAVRAFAEKRRPIFRGR